MSDIPAKPAPPDLSRLRIDRGNEAVVVERRSPWLSTLVVLALVGLGAYAFRDKLGLGGKAEATVATVRARLVKPGGAASGDVAANGYVIANRRASLASVISGRMVELNYDVGDEVKADAVVARIQFDDLEGLQKEAEKRAATTAVQIREAQAGVKAVEAQVTEAQAAHQAVVANEANLKAEVSVRERQLAEAQERLERAEREVTRNRTLWERRLIKEDEWDGVQTAARTTSREVETAQSRVRAAEALITAWERRVAQLLQGVETARQQVNLRTVAVDRATAEHAAALQSIVSAAIQVEKTFIRAPFDGLIIRKDAEIGEVIAPTGAGNSRGSVVTIIAPDSLEMQVELNERRLLGIKEGRPARIYLDADVETGWTGTVRKIWPGADRSTGTIELRVKFDKRPPYARPDMAGRVEFSTGEAPADTPPEAQKSYVAVPKRVVIKRGDSSFVWVVQDGALVRRTVTVGDSKGDSVVITDGLLGGEELISEPTAQMREGELVQTKGRR